MKKIGALLLAICIQNGSFFAFAVEESRRRDAGSSAQRTASILLRDLREEQTVSAPLQAGIAPPFLARPVPQDRQPSALPREGGSPPRPAQSPQARTDSQRETFAEFLAERGTEHVMAADRSDSYFVKAYHQGMAGGNAVIEGLARLFSGDAETAQRAAAGAAVGVLIVATGGYLVPVLLSGGGTVTVLGAVGQTGLASLTAYGVTENAGNLIRERSAENVAWVALDVGGAGLLMRLAQLANRARLGARGAEEIAEHGDEVGDLGRASSFGPSDWGRIGNDYARHRGSGEMPVLPGQRGHLDDAMRHQTERLGDQGISGRCGRFSAAAAAGASCGVEIDPVALENSVYSQLSEPSRLASSQRHLRNETEKILSRDISPSGYARYEEMDRVLSTLNTSNPDVRFVGFDRLLVRDSVANFGIQALAVTGDLRRAALQLRRGEITAEEFIAISDELKAPMDAALDQRQALYVSIAQGRGATHAIVVFDSGISNGRKVWKVWDPADGTYRLIPDLEFHPLEALAFANG